MNSLLLLITVMMAFVSTVSSARILAVLPFPSKSHIMFHFSVFQQLCNRGHHVVVYSVFLPPHKVANLTHYNLPTILLNDDGHKDYESSRQFWSLFGTRLFWELGLLVTKETFENINIKQLLASNETFDLVYIEPLAGQESLMVFGHRFKAPIINFQGFGSWCVTNWVTGSPLSLSHIPETFFSPFTNQMSFYERLSNSVYGWVILFLYHYHHLPKHDKIIQEFYNEPSLPPVADMLKDIGITFSNSFATMEYPRPYPSNFIPIAGAHLSSHMTPLAQDVMEFMDEAKEGVIYFSLGTTIGAHSFPKQYIQAFVNVFKHLRVKVLWKIQLSKEELPHLSQNVLLVKWVSQSSVLAHPNCVGFITHGGLFSQIEAFHAGVPVVGIPFFADQQHNVRFYEHLGIGVSLVFDTITEETVRNALTTILENSKYKENARRVSRIIADQPMPPNNTMIWWIEYALRHPDLRHLQPASARLPWYQLTLLDNITVLLTVVLALSIIFYSLCQSLFKLLFKNHTVEIVRKTTKIN